MPNWCSTNLRFKHKSETDAELFTVLVKKWSEPIENSGFGEMWLANIAVHAGIAKYDKTKGCVLLDGSDLFVRGSADAYEYSGNVAYIYEESAWEPAMKIWRLILKKHFPECEIEFVSEECGNGFYATNDPYVVGRYEIDVWETPEWFEDAEQQHELSFEEMKEFVNKFCKTDLSTEEELLAKARETDGIYVNKWEEMSPEDFR